MRRTHPALIATVILLAVAVVALVGYIVVGLGDDGGGSDRPAAEAPTETFDQATITACKKADAAAVDGDSAGDPAVFLLGARAVHRSAIASGQESLRALAKRFGAVEDDTTATAVVSAVQSWCASHDVT